MDDVMILMSEMYIDLKGFNIDHFGIFNDEDRVHLEEAFRHLSLENFVSILSPDQKWRLATWMCERTSFSVPQLVKSLESFTRYLKKNYKHTYPVDSKKKSSNAVKKFKS